MNIKDVLFAYSLSILLLSSALLVASMTQAQAPEELTGELIYNDTLQKVEDARKRGALKKVISNLYVKGAGECRDSGAYYYAIEFFEAALREDPDNAHAHRVYGDYLMGYRGLYEQAGTHYFRALEIIDEYPKAFDDTFRESLYRSIQIWHRDGKDGVPLLKNYSKKDYSIYFEPFIDYSKVTIDNLDHKLILVERRISAERLFRLRIVGEEDFDGKLLEANGKDFSFFESLTRRAERFEAGGTFLLRFGNEYLPYFRFKWWNGKIDSTNINPETLEDLKGEFDGYSVTAGKNFFVWHNLDMNLEATLQDRKIISRDPGNDDARIATEENASPDVDVQSIFTHYFGTNTLKLTLGTSFRTIDRVEASGTKFSDSENSQRASLRLSLFGIAAEKDNPTRFRGRRSTHYELSLRRRERDFEAGVDFAVLPQDGRVDVIASGTSYYTFEPSLSLEYFGLIGGHLDLIFNYNSITLKYKSDAQLDFLVAPPNIRRTQVEIAGRYEAHQFKVLPTWVFVYNLYEDTFTEGIEFLSVGVPLSFTTGEKAGVFTRFDAGVLLDTQWVIKPGLRVIPTIQGEYAWYPELERSDWGFFAKCILRY